ncbi:unnamed protein product, partial [Notodromas monacha]
HRLFPLHRFENEGALCTRVDTIANDKDRVTDSVVHPNALLEWLKKQVEPYGDILTVNDMCLSFKNGMALCCIIHRYRPNLVNVRNLDPENAAGNNQLAFDLLEDEMGIPPVMTGAEMAKCDVPDKLTMVSYLSQVYESFRREIPHVVRSLELESAGSLDSIPDTASGKRVSTPGQRLSLLNKISRYSSQQQHASRSAKLIDRASSGELFSPPSTSQPTLNSSKKARKRRSGVGKDIVSDLMSLATSVASLF